MFKVSFTVPASRVEKLLDATSFVGFTDPSIEFQSSTDGDPAILPRGKRGPYKTHKAQKKRRPSDTQILSLTEKTTTPGSKRSEVTAALEKLEKKHGIGKVTRKMLREQCNVQGIDHQVIYQLIHEKYIKGTD